MFIQIATRTVRTRLRTHQHAFSNSFTQTDSQKVRGNVQTNREETSEDGGQTPIGDAKGLLRLRDP